MDRICFKVYGRFYNIWCFAIDFGWYISRGVEMIDKYLLSAAEEDAKLDEEFSERVCELLIDEWNPEKFNNLSDAIANDCLYPHGESLEFAMQHNDFAEYGRLIFKAVEEYCIRQAEDQANYEFSRGLN